MLEENENLKKYCDDKFVRLTEALGENSGLKDKIKEQERLLVKHSRSNEQLAKNIDNMSARLLGIRNLLDGESPKAIY